MAAEAAPAQAGVYIYGIFPADVELSGERSGVGTPPGHAELQEAIDDLASQWGGRMRLRVLGPMAACDFAGPGGPAGPGS